MNNRGCMFPIAGSNSAVNVELKSVRTAPLAQKLVVDLFCFLKPTYLKQCPRLHLFQFIAPRKNVEVLLRKLDYCLVIRRGRCAEALDEVLRILDSSLTVEQVAEQGLERRMIILGVDMS